MRHSTDTGAHPEILEDGEDKKWEEEKRGLEKKKTNKREYEWKEMMKSEEWGLWDGIKWDERC